MSDAAIGIIESAITAKLEEVRVMRDVIAMLKAGVKVPRSQGAEPQNASRGYVYRKCGHCKKTSYMHARVRACPNCEKRGKLKKTKPPSDT